MVTSFKDFLIDEGFAIGPSASSRSNSDRARQKNVDSKVAQARRSKALVLAGFLRKNSSFLVKPWKEIASAAGVNEPGPETIKIVQDMLRDDSRHEDPRMKDDPFARMEY